MQLTKTLTPVKNMTSVPTTKSTVLGAALLTAAMALPSVQFAYADAAPERGNVSFKYLNYQESQSVGSSGSSGSSGHTHDAVSGATAGGSTGGSGSNADRIGVNAYSVSALVPIAGEWSIGTTYTYDSVSGASPTYHTSGLTTMKDHRNVIDVEATRYLSRGTVTAGTSYSKETDYISRSYSLQGSYETEDKNTTFTLGGSITNDSIDPLVKDPLTGTFRHEKKDITSGVFGVTRVLSKVDIVQFNLGYTSGNGYYSDPYKFYTNPTTLASVSLDNRPRDRNSTTLMGRWNHHFDGTDGTAHFSYRYYTDTFGIRAHTLGAEYVQPIENGWAVTPLLRFYSQTEADFYVATSAAERAATTAAPYTPTTPTSTYYSMDQRLSAFGAYTLGLKVSKQLNPDWLVDLKFEYYAQSSDWALAGTKDSGLASFSARSIQAGISRQF